MTTHETLADAVETALAYDTYTYPTIEKTDAGYTVTPGARIDLPSCDIDVMWTYENGVELGDVVSDHTRVFESYESMQTLEHLRYNMPSVVETVEDGTPVTLQWCVVDAYPEENSGEQCESCGWCEDCNADMTVGHMWVAQFQN